jgi:hypothetical protein
MLPQYKYISTALHLPVAQYSQVSLPLFRVSQKKAPLGYGLLDNTNIKVKKYRLAIDYRIALTYPWTDISCPDQYN